MPEPTMMPTITLAPSRRPRSRFSLVPPPPPSPCETRAISPICSEQQFQRRYLCCFAMSAQHGGGCRRVPLGIVDRCCSHSCCCCCCCCCCFCCCFYLCCALDFSPVVWSQHLQTLRVFRDDSASAPFLPAQRPPYRHLFMYSSSSCVLAMPRQIRSMYGRRFHFHECALGNVEAD